MSGDPAEKNDDELLSQIDELKARMDRLMSGGTSTSNSALLTDAVKPDSKSAEPKLVERPADPAPNRTRVGDLIGPEDTEVVEPYKEAAPAVPFPDRESDAVVPPREPRPEPEASPDPERSVPIGGSVINVHGDSHGPRPQVANFDDLGSAIQEELANDASVPPAEQKKGPDLASRFGPADEPVASEDHPQDEVEEEEADVNDAAPVEEDEPEVFEDADEDVAPRRRGSPGLVAAIWVFTAVASGTIAALHFTGVI